MYGKRARLGVIVPAVNAVIEPELQRMAPDGVSVYAARMGGGGETVSPSALVDMTSNADTAAEDLKVVSDAIAYGCTSGSFVNGPAWDAELIARLQEISGKPATTTSTAVVRALRIFDAHRIAIATPYPREINDRMAAYFGQLAFDVVVIDGLGVTRRGGQGHFEPEVAYELGLRVDTRDTDALIISCTNFRTIEIIQRLERELKKPVITSNQATLWDLLRISGVEEPRPGYGQLLASERSARELVRAT